MAKAGGHQHYPPTQAGNTWSTGLCGCFDDVGNCCTTFWCPCVTFGRVAEILDRGSSSCGASGALYGLLCGLTGFQCIYSCFYRKKMREQYSLPDSPCDDCVVHWCCECCALCQEYRELKNRGFNMSIGWQANVERMGGGGQNTHVPPPMYMGMNR